MRVQNILSFSTYPMLFIVLFLGQSVWAQTQRPEVNISLDNDILVLENDKIKATYLWNNGNIIVHALKNKSTNQTSHFLAAQQNFHLNGETSQIKDSELVITENVEKNYKEAVVTFHIDKIEIKQVLRLYHGVQAVSHTYFLRGETDKKSWDINKDQTLEMIETRLNDDEEPSRIGYLGFNARHSKFKAVKFYEATDHQDNPVEETSFLSYRMQREVEANLLFISNSQEAQSIFILKESPIGESQQYYPGFDFMIDYNGVSIHGLGVSPADVHSTSTQGYGYAVGISGANAIDQKKAVLEYQKKANPYEFERDFMIMSNTWGDRSKDARMNETFILKEIEAAAKLGVTHFQLDDGWQQGLSRNSASKAGMKWDDWSKEDWNPHKERFPNGLQKIMASAQTNNVKIGLWFNPSKANSYAKWERDANILLSYYRNYGISNFKIDGLDLMDKQAELNLNQLFSKVKQETDGKAVFNLDVTAGHRMGYHYFGDYGNIFLENRYTDWNNYYPYRTLRNLWLLSSYVPAQRFQMEFLNVNRNKNKYPLNDMAAPNRVGLNYAFAVTMMAQPLAWMEVSQLHEIPANFPTLIKQYKEVVQDLHTGVILPIGQEPSGSSWTGFLSMGSENQHHVLIFREHTPNDHFKLDLPFRIKNAELVFGDPIEIKHEKDHQLEVTSKKTWSFSLLRITSEGIF